MKQQRTQDIVVRHLKERFLKISLLCICCYLTTTEVVCVLQVCHEWNTKCSVAIFTSNVIVPFETFSLMQPYVQHKIRNLEIDSHQCCIREILNNSQSLRFLRICFRSKEMSSELSSFLSAPHSSIMSLEIVQCKWFGEGNPNVLLNVFAWNLQKLVINTNFGNLLSPLLNLTNLKHLALQWGIPLNATSLRLFENLPSVQYLELELFCTDINDRDCTAFDSSFVYVSSVVSLKVQLLSLNENNSMECSHFLSAFSHVANLSIVCAVCNLTAMFDLPTSVTFLELQCHQYSMITDFSNLSHVKTFHLRNVCDLKQPLDVITKFPPNLQQLHLLYRDSSFNKTTASVLDTFGTHLTQLSLNSKFNQIIKPGVLPMQLESLYFTNTCYKGKFNQLLVSGVLPQRLTTLVLSAHFNQELEPSVLPSNITYLAFGIHFDKSLDHCLPLQLRTLILPVCKSGTFLPRTLKQLTTQCNLMEQNYYHQFATHCAIYNYTCFKTKNCSCRNLLSLQIPFSLLVCPCCVCKEEQEIFA